VAGPLVVPDASVLIKWALRSADEEPRESSLALKDAWLRDEVEIVVPTLWIFEVGNVLGLKQPTQADPLLRAMTDLLLPEESPRTYVTGIFTLMTRHRVTFYDAAYHALAIARSATMLTADMKYVAKCGRAGSVQLIDRWQLSR